MFPGHESRSRGESEKAKKTTSHITETNPKLLNISPTSLHLSYFMHPKSSKVNKGQESDDSPQGTFRTKEIPRAPNFIVTPGDKLMHMNEYSIVVLRISL